jgi:hypothetical protein
MTTVVVGPIGASSAGAASGVTDTVGGVTDTMRGATDKLLGGGQKER